MNPKIMMKSMIIEIFVSIKKGERPEKYKREYKFQ